MPTWLNSQKKARLAELAHLCSIGEPEDLVDWRKDQLVPALEQILSTNPTIYSKNPAFDEYYQRRNSPIKRGGFHPRVNSASGYLPPTVNGDLVARQQQRRADLKAETESSEDSASSPPTNSNNIPLSSPSLPVAAATRPLTSATFAKPTIPAAAPTPAAPAASSFTSSYTRPSPAANTATTSFTRTPSRLQELQREAPAAAAPAPLPPSPAAVTDLIETQTAQFNAQVGEFLGRAGIIDVLQQARTEVSSMVGIHLLILAFEFFYLQSDVTVWNYLYTVNSPYGEPWVIRYPDVFVYLTGYWWKMLLTWQAMSFWIPLIVSWFFNLSLKLKTHHGLEYWRPKYKVDPLTFSITKAVIAWLVFSHGYNFFGLVSEETIIRIARSQPVGAQGLLVASYIGMATALWDGIQGKKGWQ